MNRVFPIVEAGFLGPNVKQFEIAERERSPAARNAGVPPAGRAAPRRPS